MSLLVCKRLTSLAATLACACLALPASAVTLSYGVPLSGTGPSTTFATLTYNQVGDGDDWQFTLSALDLSTIFATSGAFIGTMAVDVPGPSGSYGGGGLAMTGVSGGVSSVVAKNGGGPGGTFDFRLDQGGGSDRLKANESVSWTWNDSGYSAFTQFALHVQGLEANTGGYSGSIWYVPTPVPEPETYALMLAGLGVIGWVSRRRRG